MASSETSQSWLPKRQRADSGDSLQSLQYDDYTVGWISALPLEMTAAQAMLDHRHEPLHQHPQDSNSYEFGSINGHNVVIACLPKAQYGNNNAAIVANNMNRTFPHLQHRLLVGIAGGAPGSVDVRLGDVVVSTDAIQYDLVKALPNNHFQRIAKAISPPQSLLTMVSKLEASHGGGQNRMLEILAENAPRLPRYSHPMVEDRLFHHECPHTSSNSNCDACDISQLIIRKARQHIGPVIHYGRVASGNQVIKDALTRDKISKEIMNICFEMEAAGVMDTFPCLVIRGICDYSDSHKNKGWQEYAALAAGAYAKELLMSTPPTLLQSRKRAKVQEPKVSEPVSPESDECLRAMFVTDSSLDREGILDAKGDICEGTCEWILSTEEFQAWDQNPPHLLWISAPPGMGKTFMAIYLSKHLEALSENLSGVATIFFFSDNKVDTRNTAVSILRSLMHQLISHQPNLVNAIIPKWKESSDSLFQEGSFGALWKLFEEMIATSDFKAIYCVIDGLDECEANSLSLLLRKFERLSRRKLGLHPKMKLIGLSRRYPENIPEALLLFINLELDAMAFKDEDVTRFISVQVQELAQKKHLSRKMRSMLYETFVKKSEGTFLWVSYMSQDLHKQRLLDFETSLDMLPAGLDAVYERILHNIKLEKRKVIHDMLYWILVAIRPLTISELCEAVSIKPTRFLTCGEVCIELINSCGHLLQTVDYTGNILQWTVTFVHQSAKDYLLKFDRPFGSQISGLAHNQLHEHATIFLIRCLEGLDCIDEKSLEHAIFYPELGLVGYAINAWDHHFRQLEDITQVMGQGLSFFDKNSKARQKWQSFLYVNRADNESPPIPLLHLSAILGLNKLAEWCLRSDGEHEIETRWGTMGETALFPACKYGREHITSLLLDAGADAAAERFDGRTTVEMALLNMQGNILRLLAKTESCKKYLIEEAVNENSRLINYVARGDEEAYCLLIEDLGWNFSSQNGRAGYSALASAIKEGQFDIAIRITEEWNVLPEYHSDILTMACSSCVSEDDFERILRLLVYQCSIDINATDAGGHNALCTAFKGRRPHAFSSIKTLLRFGCNADQADSFGRTSMHCLVSRTLLGYFPDFSNIMELLVCRSQHGVNQVCVRGQTILHYLVEGLLTLPADRNMSGWYLTSVPQIVKRFLELGVDRHIQSNHGVTSLQMLQAGLRHCEEEATLLTEEYQRCVNLVIEVLEGYYPVSKDEHSL